MKQARMKAKRLWALFLSLTVAIAFTGCGSQKAENAFYGENIYEENKLRANPLECRYLENGDLQLIVGIANGLGQAKTIHSLEITLKDKQGRQIVQSEFLTEQTEEKAAAFAAAMVIPAGSTDQKFECQAAKAELDQTAADLTYLNCTITVNYSGAVYVAEDVKPEAGKLTAVITRGAFLTDQGFAGKVLLCNGLAESQNVKSFSFNLKDEQGRLYAKKPISITVDKSVAAGSTVEYDFLIVYTNENVGQGDFKALEIANFTPVMG